MSENKEPAEHAAGTVQEEKEQNKESKEAELTDTLKRLQADFENYKKRAEKEFSYCREYAEERLISELLPVLDSFEMALKNSNDNGLKTLFAQFYSVLESRGLKKVYPLNETFDPFQHEVIMQESDDKQKNNIVTEVFQAGYLLKNKLIRPARVKINKVKKDAKASIQSEELPNT